MQDKIEEIFGPKCDTYEEDCPTCVVYRALEEARQEERDNIPLGYLRQFLNERTEQERKNLLTNEVLMQFIEVGYLAQGLTSQDKWK